MAEQTYEAQKALLESKTLPELRQIANMMGIKAITGLRKPELITTIIGAGLQSTEQPASPTQQTVQQTTPQSTLHNTPSIPHHQQQTEQQMEYSRGQQQQRGQAMYAGYGQPQPQYNQYDGYGHQQSGYGQSGYGSQQSGYGQSGYGGGQQNGYSQQNGFNSRPLQAKRQYAQRTDTNPSGYRPQGQNGYPQRKPYPQTQGTGYQQGGYVRQQPYPQDTRTQGQQGGYQPTHAPSQPQYPTGQEQFAVQDTEYCYRYEQPEQQQPPVSQQTQLDELIRTCSEPCKGVIEVLSDGYGFLRCENYLPGPDDVYVSNPQIKKLKLRTGDYVEGFKRPLQTGEKFPPLLRVIKVNGKVLADEIGEEDLRPKFEKLVPIYPDERIELDTKATNLLSLRLIDLVAPIGKGQRGLIVSQPKSGKTTLLKAIANSITANNPEIHLIVLLIDERPEEVTDIMESIIPKGLADEDKARREVIYSTFDELPDHHIRVAEMAMERSMRLVEDGFDVVVLMDSITRLARAYNITLPASGKTLSGGMDPNALFKPKKFFGAARNIRDGGSLTIISTALVETGSKMDDIVYEEFKGTGNMEIHLDRKLAERRIFPAIDIYKSGTRHDEKLLTEAEYSCMQNLRRAFAVGNTADVTEHILKRLDSSSSKEEFIESINAIFGQTE